MKPRTKVTFDPEAFLSIVSGGLSLSEFEQNEIIYTQGAPADAVYYVRKGDVKISVVSALGKEAVIALLNHGEFFGEGCLAGQELRLATATALTACSLAKISKSEVIHVIHQEPAFAELFISHLLARNIKVEGDLVDQLFNSSEKRLARALLLLANFGKETEPQPVLATISQETLADMIGTTRSRVNFFMNKFRKLGLISYNGQIEVHASLLNVILHENPEIGADFGEAESDKEKDRS